MKEIDLIIENGGMLHLIEIKNADSSIKELFAFSVLDNITNVKRDFGGVVCLCERLMTLKGDDKIFRLICFKRKR